MANDVRIALDVTIPKSLGLPQSVKEFALALPEFKVEIDTFDEVVFGSLFISNVNERVSSKVSPPLRSGHVDN